MISRDKDEEHAVLVMAAAGEISRRMGWTGRDRAQAGR
jgi:hypothetical protein